MTLDLDTININLVNEIDRIKKEVEAVYSTLALPNWDGEMHGFSNTLHGYMMLCFSRIDLFSGYWKGTISSNGQTCRMIDFMQKYIRDDREVCSVAVQIWRHKLMHTAKPRKLIKNDTGTVYSWLLQWGEDHLPAEQHLTFSKTSNNKILNIGLIYLLKDIRSGVMSFLFDLESDLGLQENFTNVYEALNNYVYRYY
jgi:hypothetical protein